jgi:hypothetical protein
MTDTKKSEQASPIEVWLTKTNIQVTCRVVHEDETDAVLGVDSLSMRGAQREITAWLISRGYTRTGRWQTEELSDGEPVECFRQFKPGPNAEPV